MDVPVAYVPREKVGKNQAVIPINTVPYSNPQIPYTYTYKTLALAGTINNSIGVPPAGKRLYIKSLQLNTSITAVDAGSYFKIVCYPGAKTIFETGLLRSETTNFTFEVPLLVDTYFYPNITPSGCAFVFSSGGATLNVISINMQGWLE